MQQISKQHLVQKWWRYHPTKIPSFLVFSCSVLMLAPLAENDVIRCFAPLDAFMTCCVAGRRSVSRLGHSDRLIAPPYTKLISVLCSAARHETSAPPRTHNFKQLAQLLVRLTNVRTIAFTAVDTGSSAAEPLLPRFLDFFLTAQHDNSMKVAVPKN